MPDQPTRNDPAADDSEIAGKPRSSDGPAGVRPRMIPWWLRNLISAGTLLAVGVLLLATLGLAQRLGWIRSGSGGGGTAGTEQAAVHTCPMHPQIRQPGFGRCPICGMDLVPASAAGGSSELSVTIEPAQRRLANIRTEKVRLEPVTAEIRSVGSIAIDESRMATIASYISGRMERLFADYTGVDVAKGDHLAVVYSPELYSAQVEFLEARRSISELRENTLEVVRRTQQKLAENARRRLTELGMTDEQLAELESTGEARSRLTIYAPIGGTVIEKLTAEGDYIDAGEPIYRVANLSTVWLMLELFPEDASRVRFGQTVRAELQSLPGEPFSGRVAFIDPTVDPQKRTVGVRVEFLNEDRRLRPGDYASAVIRLPIGPQGEVYDEELAGKWISPMHPQIIRDEPGLCPVCGMDLVPTTNYGYSNEPVEQPPSLVIPRSAVLLAGSNSVVYVEEEPGRFSIRPVTLGSILRDRIIVVDGLEEGENVATAGNFLIDSQMQLAGNPSLIDPSRAVAKLQERNTPLVFTSLTVRAVSGPAGKQLEELYQAYFRIQKTLAADQVPSADDSRTLHEAAESLAADTSLVEAEQELIAIVRDNSEHLHHLPLDEARHKAFRPISHAVVELAARIRGAESTDPVYQMFCPMVKGGAGDWLQSDDRLINPYWGSGMLRCGDVVREIPNAGADDAPQQNENDGDISSDSDASDTESAEAPEAD